MRVARLRRPDKPSLRLAAWSLALVAASLIGCGPDAGPDSSDGITAARRPSMLVFARQRDSKDLDPAVATDLESGQVGICIFEGLVRFGMDSCDIEPALAERWEMSDDQRVWTFHLREGVRFHDDTPVNADAVVFSLMRQIDESHAAHRLGRMPWAEMTLRPFVESVEAVDESTVRITLREPYSPFLRNLAMNSNAVISPMSWETHGEGISSRPIGTGPYRLVEWVRDDHVLLERNPSHWGEPAVLDRIYFRAVPDNTVRLTGLLNGESHIATGLDPNGFTTVEQSPDLRLLRESGYSVAYIGFDCAQPPMDDPAFRRAVDLAIDRDHIVNNLYLGAGVPANQMVPPGMLGHVAEFPPPTRDPDQARRILEEAGYAEGIGVTFSIYSAPRPYNPLGQEIAPAVQQMLAEVGIDATIEVREFATYLDMLNAGEMEMYHLGWVTDNGDPDNFLWTHFGAADNNLHFHDETLNDLLLAATRTAEEGERQAIYRQVAERLRELCPMVFVNWGLEVAAIRADVSGFVLHPTGVHRLERVALGG